jgi:hypothetical protein
MRKHLTYANVMATIAVFGVLGGGAAYAADTVFSTDIVDGEVKTADLANNSVRTSKIATGQVRSIDIGNNQIQSADVKELSQFTEAASVSTGGCTADAHTLATCATTNITLQRAGKLLVNATGEWFTSVLDDTSGPGSESDNPTWVAGTCQLFVDGTQIGIGQQVGERSSTGDANHPFGATMALTGLSNSLSAGAHTVIVGCNEEDGDLDWATMNLTVGLVAD